MALDGANGDSTGDERSERIVRRSGSRDDMRGHPSRLAEPRTRTEYYEARAAADDGPHRADDNGWAGDRRAEGSAWYAIDVETRPSSGYDTRHS